MDMPQESPLPVNTQPPPPPPPQKRSPKGLIACAGIALLLLCCAAAAAGIYFFRNDIPVVSDLFATATFTPTATPTVTPTPTRTPTPTPRPGVDCASEEIGIAVTLPPTWECVYIEDERILFAASENFDGNDSYGSTFLFFLRQETDAFGYPANSTAEDILLFSWEYAARNEPDLVPMVAPYSFSLGVFQAASGSWGTTQEGTFAIAYQTVIVAGDTTILAMGNTPEDNWEEDVAIFDEIVWSIEIGEYQVP